MRGQLSFHGLVGVGVLLLDVDDGRHEKLAHGLGGDGARGHVVVERGDVLGNQLGELRQLEVPVLDRAQLGHATRERALRRDQLGGRVLMTHVALVGVAVLALAALHGAMPHDLAAVQKGLRLHVEELRRRALLQPAGLKEPGNEGIGGLLLLGACIADTGPLEDVERYVEGGKRRGLGVVVGAHVLVQAAGKRAGLDGLAVPLVDGRAEAVRARDEQNVVAADAVAQKARVDVGRDEDAGQMAEMQAFIAVGHARRDDRPLGEKLFHRNCAPRLYRVEQLVSCARL